MGNFCNTRRVNSIPFEHKYTVTATLGRGSFATVYKATENNSHAQYAVKEIVKHERITTREIGFVTREVEILKSLSHKNIVRFVEFIEDHDAFYIVMEHVTGGNLFNRLAEQTVYSERTARDLFHALLDTLKHAHDRDVIHRYRDIPPFAYSESEG